MTFISSKWVFWFWYTKAGESPSTCLRSLEGPPVIGLNTQYIRLFLFVSERLIVERANWFSLVTYAHCTMTANHLNWTIGFVFRLRSIWMKHFWRQPSVQWMKQLVRLGTSRTSSMVNMLVTVLCTSRTDRLLWESCTNWMAKWFPTLNR